jgi:hypothetical protein
MLDFVLAVVVLMAVAILLWIISNRRLRREMARYRPKPSVRPCPTSQADQPSRTSPTSNEPDARTRQ